MKYILNIALIAVGYHLTGRLGLMLAIPPGYATAVWPASGIALAGILLYGYRCWPGVFAGSFLINMFIGSGGQDLSLSVPLAALIASGATFQALFSAWLVRKSGAWPSKMEFPADVGKVYLWGGAIGCVINATIGTGTCAIAHGNSMEVALHWATWWVGDVVGVFVFTPVLLLILQDAEDVPVQRKIVTSTSLGLVFAIAVIMFTLTSHWEQDRQRFAFEQNSYQVARSIEKSVMSYMTALDATKSFFNASQNVEVAEFNKFTSIFFPAFPGLQGLSWNARVDDKNRAAFVKWARKNVSPEYDIRDRTATLQMTTAAHRPVYFPITYMNSTGDSNSALGYDTYSLDPIDKGRRTRALDQARDSGQTATTGKISIVQNKALENGMIFYKPVYKNDAPNDTLENRRKNIAGYIAGVFLVDDMMHASLSPAKLLLRRMNVTIYEQHENEAEHLLFNTEKVPAEPPTRQRLMTKDFYLNVGMSLWVINVTEKASGVSARYNWTLWAVLIIGLLSTAISSAFVLILTGRTASVQREVSEKTKSLKLLTEKLTRSNTELERFAYVASHDMQEPIRMIASFSSLLDAMPKDNKTDKEKKYLGFITDAAARMQAMVEDLLYYARAGNDGPRFTSVDLNKELRFAIENLTAAIQDRQAEITSDPLPVVDGNTYQLTRLFQNLLLNSLKYQQDGIAPRIRISCADEGSHWRIAVSDNGKGIPPQFLTSIFEPFKRLHSWHDKKGTGLGLAICKTIVENHGGRIWAESEPGNGSTFYFTLAKKPTDT